MQPPSERVQELDLVIEMVAYVDNVLLQMHPLMHVYK